MDNENQAEVQCIFKTLLPEKYQVPEGVEISLQTSSVNKDLSQIVKEMIAEEGSLDENEQKEWKSRKL